MTAIDFIQYSERMVGEASPDYSDTLNRPLKTVVSLSGADEDAFVGFALRPTVAPSVGQFYRATDTGVGASWQTLTTAMISDLTSASTGITKVGTVNTGVWQATSIATTYTDAKIKTVTGTVNRLTIGGTATDPTFDIAATYVGQTSIVTLGTVTAGTWTATSIATTYTDAKVVSISGTSNRVSITGTATVPIVDISGTYVGQTSIVTLGTVTTGVWTGTSIGTAYTDAKVVSISGTASRIAITGTATVPIINIDAAYVGQSSITTLGTITTGVWHGTSIDTTYTDAKLKTLTGTTNRLTVGGTATDPTVDISVNYVGQATITTLGTIVTGSWTASSIATTYTDAKVKTVTGTANRITIGGTATDPTFDVSTSYVGQNTITTVGTVTTGTWAATAITVDKGGTNIASYTIGDMIYASGATTFTKLGIGTPAQILITNGGATAPAWHTLVTADITDLTSAATGITKVGTLNTGVWNAGIINGIYGGTGVNNGSFTITLAGNLVTVGAFSLTLTTTNTTNVTLPTTGTLVNTAVTSLASLTSVGGAFAISGAFTGATTGAFSSTLSTSQLTITDTASRIIPGATSMSLRNNANNADNILISDAGAITVRSTIGGVTTITGTTATFTNLGGTLSTAAQGNVTSLGTLTSLTGSGAMSGFTTASFSGTVTATNGANFIALRSGGLDTSARMYHDGTNGTFAATFGSTGAFTPLVLATSDLARVTVAVNGNVTVSGATTAVQALTATGVTVGNGQFFKAIRNSGALVVSLLGIESGTDRTLLTVTGDFVVLNGSAATLLTLTTAGVATFTGKVTTTHAANADWGCVLGNSGNSTPQGIYIPYSAASPNGVLQEFIYAEDSTTLRFAVRSNGGIANFSANNANLSDETVKTMGASLDGAMLTDVFRRINPRLFKYRDQTHSDWNIGFGARELYAAFEGTPYADSIVDREGWSVDKLWSIYETDFVHTMAAVVKHGISRVDDLEARVAKLEKAGT